MTTEERKISLRDQEQQLLSSIQACKTRAILTVEQAVEIFSIKLSNQARNKGQNISPCSVAREFGVSAKAVRDIWKGRTWLRETMHLDPARVVMVARRRPPGRPRLNLRFTNSRSTNASTTTEHSCCEDFDAQRGLARIPQLSQSTAPSQPGHAVAWWDRVQPTPPAEVLSPRVCPPPIATMESPWLGGTLSADKYAAHLDYHSTSYPESANIDRPRLDDGCRWSLFAGDAAPLPESTRADDPFHDDWRYWPKLDEGEEAC